MDERIAEIRALVEYTRSRVTAAHYQVPRGGPLHAALRDAYEHLDLATHDLVRALMLVAQPTGHAPAAGE